MERISRLWAAVLTGFLATLLIPAAAWAEDTGIADEFRKRKGLGFFGIAPLLCCLVVVAVIVLVVFLVMRSRKK